MDPSSPYVLTLVGRAELRDGKGTVVPLATRKLVLLLAVLATEPGRPFRRGELAAIVWEDADGDAARKSLRNALAVLRRALPDEAIDSDLDTVSLRSGIVSISNDGDKEGEFLPGIDAEWAIDRRLLLRAERVRAALTSARTASDPIEALRCTERACRIDPLDTDASTLRATLLRAQGRVSDAGEIETAHRKRVVRELGALPLPRTTAVQESAAHPLVAAAEWLLDRDPDEACALVASTQAQWMATSVDRALQIHERTLVASVRPGPNRRAVVAGAHLLRTMTGQVRESSDVMLALYRDARTNGEPWIALRLAEALAYGHLSRGEFAAANDFARETLDVARRSDAIDLQAAAGMVAGIIELHTGREERSGRRIEASYRLAQEHGSSPTLTSFRINYAASLLRAGRIERSVELIDATRRECVGPGRERHLPWLAMLESELHERLGDDVAALQLLEGIGNTVIDAGQAAVAARDDLLARVHCRLGEYASGAEALARATTYRRRLGTVPSEFERNAMAPSVERLRSQLSRHDLKAAFDRARFASA